MKTMSNPLPDHAARLAAMLAAACAVPCVAGTVRVERVEADLVQVREIGALPMTAAGILYYPFSSDTGSSVQDESGNGHTGAASGCVWTGSGASGGAMLFDGVDDRIDVGSAPDFPAWERYTVGVWFRHDGGGDFGAGYGHKIIDKTSMYHDWYIRLYHTNGGLGWIMYENGQTRGLGVAVSNYMDNVWHHVVAVRDGTNGQLWVDGALMSAGGGLFNVYSSSSLCVGNSLSTDYYQRKSWSGALDEVCIFDKPLSPLEIAQLYAAGPAEPGAGEAPAVSVISGLAVDGDLSVGGQATFAEGVRFAAPLGDLSCGIYTNTP